MGKSKFELSVELVKALIWPAIVSALLISFWKPLHETANLLPTIVNRSDTITIAGLSLKVGHEIQREVPAEVRSALKQLPASDISKLLVFHGSGGFSEESYLDYHYGDLVRIGLVSKSFHEEYDSLKWEAKLSPLGIETKRFLASLLAEIMTAMEPK